MISRLFGIVVFLTAYYSIGQVNQHFVEHLSENKLQIEHWTYLNKLDTQSDSVQYYVSKYHLQYGEDSSFLLSLEKSHSLFYTDRLAMHYANNYFLAKENQFSARWFKETELQSNALTGLPLIYYSAYHPNETDINSLSKNLQNDFLRLQKADKKRPFLAATFSAFIPGSGKLYIGSTRSFLLTFVSLSILGLQTLESYNRLGIKHPLTIINAGLFSLYYTTNIFGSYRETKTKKENRRKQFLINASKHYNNSYTFPLY